MSNKDKAAAEALERKLRPLYDAIDSRQYKQALKLAAALLQAGERECLARSCGHLM